MTLDVKGRAVVRPLSKHEYMTCLYILGDMWTSAVSRYRDWRVSNEPRFEPENVRAYYLAPRYQMARYCLTGAL